MNKDNEVKFCISLRIESEIIARNIFCIVKIRGLCSPARINYEEINFWQRRQIRLFSFVSLTTAVIRARASNKNDNLSLRRQELIYSKRL